MRIASIYLPSFPLQAALASSPGAVAASPIAVINALGAPVVVACSRAAWAQGVRPGMVASIARGHCPELHCVVRDGAGEVELVRGLADALLALTPSIDLGGPIRGQHHTIFVEVPAGKRGSAFGSRAVEVAAAMGLRVRVGIADDRFTAAVAASHGGKDSGRDAVKDAREGDGVVTCVPRGGAAAFLAPLPLGLLHLPAEVQHMLEALGVKTLGAFAELPPPSVAHASAFGTDEADLQAFARGDGDLGFEPYRPAARLHDRVELRPGAMGPAVQRLAGRLAARLTGRGSARAEVELAIGDAPIGAVTLTAPYEADAVGDVLARAIGDGARSGVLALHAIAHDEDGERDGVAGEEAVPVAVAPLAEGSAAIDEPGSDEPDPARELAPLVLTPVPSVLGHRPEHRRTRRGKQRPRIAPGQARLFSRDGFLKEPGA